jgi:Raf kinase inhibitor-like YbhB/YbcL family protein
MIFILIGGLCLVGCGAEPEPTQPQATQPALPESSPTESPEPPATIEIVETEEEKVVQPMEFKLSSPAFQAEEPIPTRFACDAEDLSPELGWGDPPEGTQSFVLIMDDPDAPVGTWVHWVLFNIPGAQRGLSEGISPEAEFADGSLHGENSWGNLGYGGPCPPSGTHRYFFKLYAIDFMLDLPSGASKAQVMDAIEGHVLAESELMGIYTR